MYSANKRKKELKRQKKQEEKRQRRQKNTEVSTDDAREAESTHAEAEPPEDSPRETDE
jgi:hypothetical protein